MNLQYWNRKVKVKVILNNGIKYRALIYINDNTVKYIQPLSDITNEQFVIHALKMIGWG